MTEEKITAEPAIQEAASPDENAIEEEKVRAESYPPDEELIPLAQAGDEKAMETLIKKYLWLSRSIARKYFLTNGDHDDLLQEGLMGIYKGIRNYDPASNGTFPGFLSVTINSAIKDAVRKSTRAKQRILTEATSLEDFDAHIPARYVYDPVHNYIEREGVESFYERLRVLFNPRHIEILKYYLDGYTYAEIAEMTNLSTKKVDNTLTYVKNRMKKREDLFFS